MGDIVLRLFTEEALADAAGAAPASGAAPGEQAALVRFPGLNPGFLPVIVSNANHVAFRVSIFRV